MNEFFKKHSLYILIAIIALPLGVLLCMYGFDRTASRSFEYSEASSAVDYQVCNKESDNPLIDRCGKQDLYVASLIDYISTQFIYSANFSQPVSGSLDYQLTATVSALRSDGQKGGHKYGEKQYNLSDKKHKQIDKQNNISILEGTKIDYAKYNSIVNEFRKDSPSAKGHLRVSLKVTGNLNSEGYEHGIPVDASMHLEFDLAERDVEIGITQSSSDSTPKSLVEEYSTDTPLKFVARLAGEVSIFALIVCVVVLVYFYMKENRGTAYEENIKKVLSIYDSIIVATKFAPNLRGVNVIDVSDFDEILDVYNAVHMPINFHRTKQSSHFIVLNGDTAWRYIVRESDFEEKDKKTKKSSGEDQSQNGGAPTGDAEGEPSAETKETNSLPVAANSSKPENRIKFGAVDPEELKAELAIKQASSTPFEDEIAVEQSIARGIASNIRRAERIANQERKS